MKTSVFCSIYEFDVSKNEVFIMKNKIIVFFHFGFRYPYWKPFPSKNFYYNYHNQSFQSKISSLVKFWFI